MTDPSQLPPESAPPVLPVAERLIAAFLAGPPGTGANLTGPRRDIDRVLERIGTLADPARLLLLPVMAAATTPPDLRRTVEQALSGRHDRDTRLLLAVPDAGLLSADMLRELEQAAEAARQHGGLVLLLGSNRPLSPLLDEAGLSHLHAVMRTVLDAAEAGLVAAPRQDLVAPPREEPRALVATGTPPARRRSFLTLLLILLSLLVLSAGALLLFGPRPQPARPVPPPTEFQPGQAVNRWGRHADLLMRAQPGDTLLSLYQRVYAGADAPPFTQVQQMNPSVAPGARLVFPPPRNGWPDRP